MTVSGSLSVQYWASRQSLSRCAEGTCSCVVSLNCLPARVWLAVYHNSRLTALLTHLGDHIHEPLTLAEAAAITCMQRTAFSRFFKRATGIPYREFLRAFRISPAILLLEPIS